MPHTRFALPDRSYQGVIRSELRKFAESAGFKNKRLAEIEIIVAEITSNLVKYATKGGEILARKYVGQDKGIELIAIDQGPGISRPVTMLEDGQSSGNSLGQGLGAIKRLSDIFDMYSLVNWGTVLYSRIYLDKKSVLKVDGLDVNIISVPKQGETACGDSWFYQKKGKRSLLSVIDGLGHGPQAYIAASRAVEALNTYAQLKPNEQCKTVHGELRKTRGAVLTIASLDEQNRQVTYTGVGNISMKIVSPGRTQTCNSYNGIVGHILPSSLNEHHSVWDLRHDVIIMHSDGLSARWDLQKYPRIQQHHGIIICAALYKDHRRESDDSTVLVAKLK